MSTVSNFGVLWCSSEEERYLTLVENDLTFFSKKRSVKRVLVFPPLSSKFRFFIHKVVERWPELKSCSIGSEPNRRTVVYFKQIVPIHKTPQLMSMSKVETEQETECSHRGGGRGVKGREQTQRSPRNSPTASRRPPRALYSPGAFSKQRTNTDGQTKQVSSQHQQDCESMLENKGDSMSENEKGLGCDKLNISSSTDSGLVENRLNDMQEEKCTKKSLNHATKARVGSLDVSKQANDIDSNCDNSVDILQLRDSAGHSIHSDCSVHDVHTSKTNVLLENDQERLSDDSNGKTSKKAMQVELPKMKKFESSESSTPKTIPNQKQVSKITVSKKKLNKEECSVGIEKKENIKAPVGGGSRTNTESSDVHDHKTNGKDSVKVNGGVKSISDESNKGLSNSISEIDQASQGKTISVMFSEYKKNNEEESENKQVLKVNLNDEDNKRSLQKSERPKTYENVEKDLPQSESESLHNENNLNNKDSEIIPGNNQCFVSDEKVENYARQSNCECPHKKKDLTIKDNSGLTLVGNDIKTLVNSDCQEKVQAQSKELQCKQDDSNDKVDVKIVQGNNDGINKNYKNLVEQKSSLNDAEIEMNESVVDSENENHVQSRSQSKSKRQSKKEEKAKKKEEKLKKRQVKTKSEKTVKKGAIKEKVIAKEGEVSELVDKEGNKKGVKIKHEKATTSEVLERKGQSSQQETGKQADATADDQGLKIVRECKDTLLRLSVSEGSGNENSAEEDWEKTWDDEGECLEANLLAELHKQIGTTNVQVVKPQFDYFSFKPNDTILENGVFDHVVEIFDFSPEFKNHDLQSALSKFQQHGFTIQWVDDTHALAVFTNHRIAQQAIQQCSSPMVKLRSVYEGTQQSKLKAKRNISELQPYKERPKTTKLVANRLVAGALGMKSKMSKEERQLEREKIKAEREKKLNKEKLKKDLWDSDDL